MRNKQTSIENKYSLHNGGNQIRKISGSTASESIFEDDFKIEISN